LINIINKYLKNGYSLISVNSEKEPYVYWKSFHYKKANTEDVFGWYNKFTDVNIGIVTGNISKLAVIDVDDINLLPELKEILSEIKETTKVRTRKGYHYYFSLNGEYVKSNNSLFGKRLELRSNGKYVVAPPSIINGFKYIFEVPLGRMLSIPKKLIKKTCLHTDTHRQKGNQWLTWNIKSRKLLKYQHITVIEWTA